jgi:hypothetical protein
MDGALITLDRKQYIILLSNYDRLGRQKPRPHEGRKLLFSLNKSDRESRKYKIK